MDQDVKFFKNLKKYATKSRNHRYIILSRVILLIGLGLGNKKAPGRGAFLL
jgi:hypothetical protein